MLRHHLIGTLVIVMGLLVALLIGSVATVSGEPFVIDFEDLSTSGLGQGDQVEVSTQYTRSKGITFNSPVALDYSKGLAIHSFAHSGTKAIEQCYAKEFCTTPIEMSFTRAQSRVKVWAGYSSRIDETRTVILKAFDINGKEVDRAEETLDLIGEPLPILAPLEVTSESADIIQVVVSFSPDTILMNNLAVDDVEFEIVEPPLLLAGRVYEGEVGDESHPLQGVTVEVYGANNPYPDPGVLIVSTTTDEYGWYRLEVPAGYEFYSIRETSPPGYESVGATTVDGTVRTSNWIEYVIPLEEETLTGNKFWVKGPALPTPLLSVSPDPPSYSFDLTAGETSSRELSISNAGGGTLTWTVGADQRWINVYPQSGTNSDTVTINIDTADLSPGSYTGTITVTSNGGIMIGEIFLTLPPIVTPRPAPEEGPDLTISSTDYWFEDDGRVLVLFVEIANQGNTAAPETLVYVKDIEHDWLHEYSSVQASDPDETIPVEIWLDIPEKLRGMARTFIVEVDPEDAVREIDEENNEAIMQMPPPVDELPLLEVVITLGAIGGIIFITHHTINIRRRKEWQGKSKEEEPPETCQPGTRYCHKIELELEPALRKITHLSFGTSAPVSGEQSKERQVKGELVDRLNKAVMAHRRREKPEKLQEQVEPLAHTLLQQNMEWLRGESAHRDIFVTGHMEGGKVTCQFSLYHCKRRGTVNVWEEDAKWNAKIKDEHDEFVGTLRGMEPTELRIPEQEVSDLTRLLIQFIEKV